MGAIDKEDLKQEDVKVGVIIADTFEKKFGPLTENKPQTLNPLAGKPILEYTLTLLLNSGIKDVIVFSSSLPEQIREYVKLCPLSKVMRINVVSNEDAVTLGDAMRHLYDSGLIRDTFVLLNGCVVGNADLSSIMEVHKARAKDDKDLTMTLIFKRATPGHHLRTTGEQVVLATVPETKKIVHHAVASGRKIEFPLELFSSLPEVDISFDVVGSGVAVCSPNVLGLFADNFDVQTMGDFIKSCIEDDLADYNLYSHVCDAEYLAKVSDMMTYLSVTKDVLNRWLFPCVPDKSYVFTQHQVYKPKDLVVGRNAVLEEDIIVGKSSTIGDNSTLSGAAIGNRVKIGNGVSIKDCIIHDDVVIGDNCVLNSCVIGASVNVGKGVKIEAKSLLGPSVVIDDGVIVPENTWLVSSDGFSDAGTSFGSKAFRYQEESESDDSDEEDAKEAPLGLDWGKADLTNDEDESTDSEAESDLSDMMDQMGGGDLLLDEDAKVSVFLGEITESLQRGIEEGVDTNNLILEVNSSRHAYAINATQVIQNVVAAVLSISFDVVQEANNKLLLSVTKKNLFAIKDLLANYVKSSPEQLDLLKGMESYFCTRSEQLPIVPQLVHSLYDMDLVEEEAIIEWSEGLGETDHDDEEADPEFASNLKKRLESLIAWLQEEDESSDE